MKIVHINKKDLERERQLNEAASDYMRHQSKLVLKNYIKRMAKIQALEEANKKAGLQPPKDNGTASNQPQTATV